MNTETAVQSFLYNRRSRNLRPATIKWYEKRLQRFTAFSPDLPTEPESLEQFLTEVVPQGKDEARHGYFRAVRALYRFHCRRHRLPNPVDYIDPPARRKKVAPTLTAEDMLSLLTRTQRLRDLALMSLFIDCGPRCGEAASLRPWNIFPDYIKVDGKTGERETPISEETRQRLLSLVSADGSQDHVFVGQRGPLTTSGIYKIVRKYMEAAGISKPKLGPHRIRHGFGKNFITNGGDTRSLQKIMGHANISTTEIYIELSQEEVRGKHHQFTPLRSTHAAAQANMFGEASGRVQEELDEILTKKEAEDGV
ncbi:MAG: tyrosine-type recombinase/integrase [Calditrichaeota bacterium]|nr:tyrosine-type recombinase/integrase [Calditrichota bacterium]